jgi:hypothetical protein
MQFHYQNAVLLRKLLQPVTLAYNKVNETQARRQFYKTMITLQLYPGTQENYIVCFVAHLRTLETLGQA